MINQVIDIVREAGRLFGDKNFEVQNKGTASNNVTSVDLAVEAFLKQRLIPLIDGCGFIGEESEDSDYERPYLWIVDPVDGTANFIRDMGLSAISVGLVHGGEAILGVVYNPYRDEMFYAEKGKGAFLNGEPIRVSDRDVEHSVFCTALSLYNKDFAKPCLNIIEKVYERCDDIRRLGTAALELVYLACGRAELYFEMRLFAWDFAGAEIIIREAGGFVGTIEYERTVFHRPIPIICTNTKENYDYLKAIVSAEIPVIPYSE
ncbi:inositol monophosphatase family protein [Paenibacillus kobensis]|uniref:inositol monophosphatase family protein n=1 Tax=Paenibacillus kobensis TaxID=59841 RepID=UPI000FD9D84A|nr:inositol monophosphatase family protein [Paenibacillus kobensis]